MLFTRFAPALATILLESAPALAQNQSADSPVSLRGAQVISVEEGRQLVGTAAFVDVRLSINYGRGHIKGAKTLPYTERSERTAGFDFKVDFFDVARLPKDKALPIVFYSEGPYGWKAYKAAALAVRAGYSSVKWMRAGVQGWTDKGGTLE